MAAGMGVGIIGLASITYAADETNAVAGTNAPAATNAPAVQPYGKRAKEGFLRRLNEAEADQFGTP
jgi:hypothetical protein